MSSLVPPVTASRRGSSPRLVWLALGFGLLLLALSGTGVIPGGGFLRSLAYQLPEFGLLSLAMALPMLTGGINLAVVAIANLSAIVTALAFGALAGGPFADIAPIPLGLLAGAFAGALIGLVVAYLRVTPVLASLCAMLIFTGIGVLVTGGSAVGNLPAYVPALAASAVLGIPVIAFVFLAAVLALAFVLARTPFGFRLRAVGLNEPAAHFAGVDTRRLYVVSYALSGLLSASAGLIMLSRFNSARMGYADSYLLATLLAAVLGGINPDGGRGSVWGLFLAVVALQVTASVLNLAGASQHATGIAWGLILLAKLAYDRHAPRRSDAR
ncbi:sugar ABC transporter permease [Kaistia sp. 32K]|uniref:ABC transporter permease n=1 Tax=Kaistia sp. 32K TaxID=2795690 RepID=UPI0019168A7D|nr:ABC transporter permease [Kaistia sp. 32K]BCP54845.1 sugar ABC transporter permease [Kaistia sp. 32K]